jgi:hypothetical protein
MANVFTVLDIDGTPVHLSVQTWRNHILFRHRFMARYLEAMKVTVANPTRAYRNTDYEEGLSYWRIGLGEGKQAGRWMAVVVNYKKAWLTKREYGSIVTAYFAEHTPPDELRVD